MNDTAAVVASVVMLAVILALVLWLITLVAREQEKFAYLTDLDRDDNVIPINRERSAS
jgi:hypothetical protein